MARLQGVASLTFVVLLAACGSSSGNAPSGAPTVSECHQAAGAGEVQSAYRETLRGLDRGFFAGMRLGREQGFPGSGAHTLYLTLSVPSTTNGAATPMEWEATLAAADVAARLSGCPGEPPLTDYWIRLQLPGHAPRGDAGGPVAANNRTFRSDASRWSDSEISQSVDRTLRGSDLTPKQVRVLHPWGTAIYAVATVADRRQLKNKAYALETAFADQNAYEGTYLQIELPDGEPLYRDFGDNRLRGGGVWFAPGIDSLWGISHG